MLEWMLMPYRRYFDFSGRSRRKEFWMFALFSLIVNFVLMAIMFGGGFNMSSYMAAVNGTGDPSAVTSAFGPLFWVGFGLSMLFALGSFIPNIALMVRRLHDRNMSGWFLLLFFVLYMIPLVNFLVLIGFIVLMCLEGTRGPNKYGPDPKDPAGAEVFA